MVVCIVTWMQIFYFSSEVKWCHVMVLGHTHITMFLMPVVLVLKVPEQLNFTQWMEEEEKTCSPICLEKWKYFLVVSRSRNIFVDIFFVRSVQRAMLNADKTNNFVPHFLFNKFIFLSSHLRMNCFSLPLVQRFFFCFRCFVLKFCCVRWNDSEEVVHWPECN